MQQADRRSVLIGATGLGAALAATPALAAGAKDDLARIADDQRRYLGFGQKAAGGPGDIAAGAWLESELTALGFTIARQPLRVPFFDIARATLTVGGTTAPVLPQPIVVPTPADGVSGPLVRVSGAGIADRPLAGAIAILDLPSARWSTATAKGVQAPVRAAIAAGAVAVVIVTNGPTGEAIALNADGRKPMFDRPVAIVAPKLAAPFFAAATAGTRATLVVTGTGGRRPATNFVARREGRGSRWLIVSTPRSGWTTCAAERGSGVAAWLALARWAPQALSSHKLAFVCNTGHEYEYLGSEEALETAVPKPAETAAWLHIGANLGGRDWHEFGDRLLPLDAADSARFLAVSPGLLPAARAAFAGQPGLASPYSAAVVAAGELVPIMAAGYTNVAGTFGAHRYHHVAGDDARCLVDQPVADAVGGFQKLLRAMVAADPGKG